MCLNNDNTLIAANRETIQTNIEYIMFLSFLVNLINGRICLPTLMVIHSRTIAFFTVNLSATYK